MSDARSLCADIISMEEPASLESLLKKPRVGSSSSSHGTIGSSQQHRTASDEFMRQGKLLKSLADNKFEQQQTKHALKTYTLSAVCFYQAALKLKKAKQTSAAHSLLAQTASFLIANITKCQAKEKSDAVAALAFFVAAVCYGRAFTVGARAARADHKAALASARDKKLDTSDCTRKALEAANEAHKAVEMFGRAKDLGIEADLTFDRNIFMLKGDALNVFVDNTLQSLEEAKKI